MEAKESPQGLFNFREIGIPYLASGNREKLHYAPALPLLEPVKYGISRVSRNHLLRDSLDSTFWSGEPKLFPTCQNTAHQRDSRKNVILDALQAAPSYHENSNLELNGTSRLKRRAVTVKNASLQQIDPRSSKNLKLAPLHAENQYANNRADRRGSNECGYCGMTLDTRDGSSIHHKGYGLEGSRCQACSTKARAESTRADQIKNTGSPLVQTKDRLNKHMTKSLIKIEETAARANCFEVFTCTFCYLKFSCELNLSKHVFDVHRRGKGYSCESCEIWFETLGSLNIHKGLTDH